MENISIGTDIEEIKRFEGRNLQSDYSFLKKIFTDNEINYCYKDKKYAQHLCARFCGKEAVIKALYSLNINNIFYSDIEILNNADGVPFVNLKKLPDLSIKISLSHCKTHATATALIIK